MSFFPPSRRRLAAVSVLGLALACDAVTVQAPLVVSVEVVPQSLTVAVGESQQLQVTVRDADGTPLSSAGAAWTSSSPGVAEVSSAGVVSGISVGNATITARVGGVSGSASVTVSPSAGFTVDRTSAAFTAEAGGATSAPQPIVISATGTVQASALLATVAYTQGQPAGWLTARLSSTTTPALLTLTADGGPLPVGSYGATVSISAPGYAPTDVAVSLTVRGSSGEIVLDRTLVAIQATRTGSVPSAEIVSISNSGAGALTGLGTAVDYGTGQTGWLTTRLSSTTASSAAPAVLTINANQAGLPLGSHTARVLVTSPDATNSPQAIDVSLTVSLAGGPPQIGIGADSVVFAWSVGTATPPPQSVAISNLGGGTLSGMQLAVSYAPGQPTGWLVANLGSSTAPTQLSLSVVPGSLGAGSYVASVEVVSAVATNSPQFLRVRFDVTSGPLIAAAPTAVAFSAVQGGGNPANQSVSITNAGTGTLTGLSAPVVYAPGQPTGWLTASLGGTTAPATLTLSAVTGSLAAGVHRATVNITSAGANNSPTPVEVSFTVQTVQPSIVLAPAVVQFDALTGASPAMQTVSVTNGGGLPLTGLTVGTIAYGGGASGWLAAALGSGTAPTSLTLTPTTSALAEGTYTATVPVTSPVAPTRTVSVTLNVSDPPRVGLSTGSLSFQGVQGGADPPAQTVGITNTGTAPLTGLGATVNYGAGATGWLTTSLNATTAPATLTVNAALGSLAPGTYNASIDVTSTAAGVVSAPPIAVSFVVAAPPPAIGLAPTSLAFAATANTSAPAAQSIAVTNTGGQTLGGLTAVVSPTATWLTVTLNGTTAPTTIDVQPNTAALAAGTYTTNVVVSATGAANSPQSVPVTYTVVSPPTIVLAPTSLKFTAEQGAPNPAARTVAITNGGGSTLSGLATSVTYGSGQPSGWLAASLGGTTAPATLSLTATTGALTTGTYTATVAIASTAAGVTNSPQTVAVEFEITEPPPAIGLGTGSLSFTTAQNTGLPAAKTVSVTNAGGGTLMGLQFSVGYSGTGGWLNNVSMSSTTAPATLSVQPSNAALAPGTYNATISITGTGASNNPQAVSVVYTVTAPPAIALSPTSVSFSAIATGADPAAQTVAVTNSGSGTLSGLSVVTAGLPSWLSASVSPTTAPATVTITPSITGLGAGTYTAQVPVASSAAGVSNSPRNIAVTLVVHPQPTIVRDKGSVLISVNQGQSAAELVQITEAGGNPMPGIQISVNYTSASTGWLTTSLSSSAAPATLTLTGNGGSLPVGSHTADVLISVPGATNTPVDVQVTLDVQASISIAVSDETPSISGVTAGGTAVSDSITVFNGGGGTLTGLSLGAVNYGGGATGWLAPVLTATSATNTTPAYVRLTVDPSALVAGQTYTATFTLSSPAANNSPRTITVTVVPN